MKEKVFFIFLITFFVLLVLVLVENVYFDTYPEGLIFSPEITLKVLTPALFIFFAGWVWAFFSAQREVSKSQHEANIAHIEYLERKMEREKKGYDF